VEAIRALMVAKRSARAERTQTVNQARALILTGPDDLRVRFAQHTAAALVAGTALLRPRPGDAAGYATRFALRELGRHCRSWQAAPLVLKPYDRHSRLLPASDQHQNDH
jgi:hypothetical protein